MVSLRFTFWKGEKFFVGFLNEYPDYWTQGETVEDLKALLADLYRDLTSGDLPGVRQEGTLEVEAISVSK